MNLDKLTTEQRNENSNHLDEMSIHEFATMMNRDDQTVALNVKLALPAIERAIAAIADCFRAGGRLFYVGAGSSGRMGVLDAAECVPTFGTNPDMVQGLIAGGLTAMTLAVEGAEDKQQLAVHELRERELGPHDCVVGITASGRTPYVVGGLNYARKVHATTIAFACNEDSLVGKHADITIEVPVGPEVLTGSTRLKSGTAQKMVLNMLSTGAMVQIGKVYKNLMVDVRPTNEKLVARAKRIIQEATGCSSALAAATFAEADHDAKLAIVMILTGLPKAAAKQRLRKENGFIGKAIGA
ncbi:N-acetylmuramic acid 6-phosphate etherase [Lacticaseibacillus zhaodongensis]|uniref:N-acetylmuramic acid 6-phosphate etherase n=1 Tax=Lacticaseibacillus zhaodongensis TaxID=2668065 RepID=UPI0012D349FD|nr:N-acetylmuramic acid 6-phosphate etherase [Lacticaseibacillus zhaodongensis]